MKIVKTIILLAVMGLLVWAAMRFAEWIGLGNMMT